MKKQTSKLLCAVSSVILFCGAGLTSAQAVGIASPPNIAIEAGDSTDPADTGTARLLNPCPVGADLVTFSDEAFICEGPVTMTVDQGTENGFEYSKITIANQGLVTVDGHDFYTGSNADFQIDPAGGAFLGGGFIAPRVLKVSGSFPLFNHPSMALEGVLDFNVAPGELIGTLDYVAGQDSGTFYVFNYGIIGPANSLVGTKLRILALNWDNKQLTRQEFIDQRNGKPCALHLGLTLSSSGECCIGSKTIVRTWTADDGCDTATCEQLISVFDTTAPAISCPPTYAGAVGIAPAISGAATATDHVDPNPVVTFTDSQVTGSCPGFFVRTWTATDDCGNASTCDQTITVGVSDTTPPVINCPPTYAGAVGIDPALSGMATATDSTNPNPVITYLDGPVSGTCPASFVRVWKATDACGNVSTCGQTITIGSVDNTPPMVVCPPDATVECGDDVSPAATGIATATDHLDPNPVVTHRDVEIRCLQGGQALGQVDLPVETGSDNGFQYSYVHAARQGLVTVDGHEFYTEGTLFQLAPNGGSYQGNFTAPGVVDITGSVAAVNHPDFALSGTLDFNVPAGALIGALDFVSGQDSGTFYVFNYNLVGPANGINGTKLQIVANNWDNTVMTRQEFIDQRGGKPCGINLTVTVPAGGDCCPLIKTIVRTWTATDACGNSGSCTQLIKIQDTLPPVIVCPPDANGDNGTDPAQTGEATVTECSDYILTYVDGSRSGTCPAFFFRTWTVTDTCGNAASCDQKITIGSIDNVPPVVSCPPDATVECGEDISPAATGVATATDNLDPNPVITHRDVETPCIEGNLTGQHNLPVVTGSENGFEYSYVHGASQGLVVVDGHEFYTTGTLFQLAPNGGAFQGNFTAPGVVDLSGTVSVSNHPDFALTGTLNFNVPAGALIGTLDFVSGQDSGTFYVFNYNIVGPANGINGTKLQILANNWDNTTMTRQEFRDQQGGKPCGINLTVTVPAGGDCCPLIKTIVRSWTATDACGNVDTCVQTISVEDNTPPVITCPIDTTVGCTDSVDPLDTGVATATDNCGDAVVTYVDGPRTGECTQSFVRTWTATDGCGNQSTCAQVIMITDNTNPVIICPPDISDTFCVGVIPDIRDLISATDDCTAPGDLVYTQIPAPGTSIGPGTYTITVTVTDKCGNGDSCNVTIVIDPLADSSIGDRVWIDADNDGIQGPNEVGISGVRVELLDADMNFITEMNTGANGIYTFDNLLPGNYFIRVTPPVAYVFSPKDQVNNNNDAVDSDVDVESGTTDLIALGCQEHINTVDAGLYEPLLSALGDRVWEDFNANGIQDQGEPGIPNVLVELFNVDTLTKIGEQVTDGVGHYFFDMLPAANYYLRFTAPPNFIETLPLQGLDLGVESNVTNGETGTNVLPAGVTDPTIDAGYYRLAEVGDRVWFDTNGNGIQDLGESGVPGVQVILSRRGVDVADMLTDANGNYLFGNLPPGRYRVTFIIPPDHVITLQDQGTDDEVDSDIGLDGMTAEFDLIATMQDPNGADSDIGLNGMTVEFDLVSNQSDLTRDAGIIPFNADIRIQKTVYGGHDSGTQPEAGRLEFFQGLLEQDITWFFVITNTGDTHLDAITFSDPDLGIDINDLVALPTNPNLPLAPGQSLQYYYETVLDEALLGGPGPDLEFINVAGTSGNPVFPNGDDIPNVPDPSDDDPAGVGPGTINCTFTGQLVCSSGSNDPVGLGDGITVVLLLNTQVILSVTTDPDGRFSIPALPAVGQYQLQVPASVETFNADTVSGPVVTITDPSNCTAVTPTVFTYTRDGVISGFVYQGPDNGTVVESEGLNGVTVELFQVVGEIETLVDSTITAKVNDDSKGFYSFENFSPGEYTVRVSLQNVETQFNLSLDSDEPKHAIGEKSTTEGMSTITCEDGVVNFPFEAEPTYVSLKSFTATAAGNDVLLEWATAAELDNLGFMLYRSATEGGAKVAVNTSLVLGQGTGTGQNYQLVDANVGNGTWYYYLEDIEYDFDKTLHGPAVVAIGSDANLASIEDHPAGIHVIVLDDVGNADVLVNGSVVASHAIDGALIYYVAEQGVTVDVVASDAPTRMDVVDSAPAGGNVGVLSIDADGNASFTSSDEFDSYLLAGFVGTHIILDVSDAGAPKIINSEVVETDGSAASYFTVDSARNIEAAEIGEE